MKPNAAQLTGLKRWFWFVAFTQRYKAGTNVAVMEDIRAMHSLASGDPVFDAIDAEISPSFFMKTWRINSTAAKATICLLAQCAPRSFLSNSLVDLSTAMSAYNAREFHHVYPKAFLNSQGIKFNESNIIANVCFLNQADNRAISDSSPADYMPKIDAARRSSIAASSLLPVAVMDGSMNYADFVQMRAKMLAVAAHNLIKTAAI